MGWAGPGPGRVSVYLLSFLFLAIERVFIFLTPLIKLDFCGCGRAWSTFGDGLCDPGLS
jgi:hypothetical protein